MSANETQVGGTHYQSKFQHWDFVSQTGLGYFLGQVTKYVSRWRKKNGLQDLEKAHHFLTKFMEEELTRRRVMDVLFTEFVKGNELGEAEKEICGYIVSYHDKNEMLLGIAEARLKNLIAEEREKVGAAKKTAEEWVEDTFATKEDLTA